MLFFIFGIELFVICFCINVLKDFDIDDDVLFISIVFVVIRKKLIIRRKRKIRSRKIKVKRKFI